MRVQYELLLWIFIINLTVGLVIILAFPGTEYVSPSGTGVNATDYEAHFNSSEIIRGWGATPFSGIPVIGDIFSGFNFLVQDFGYLIDGLPTLLTYLRNTYITDSTGMTVFDIIANTLRAVYALLMCVFLIEFFSGRIFSD